MSPDVKSASIYTDFAGLAKLKSDAANNTESAQLEAAQQFEALFIQFMLKSMREATPGEDLTGSDQVDMYRDMFDKQLSIDLSQKGGLGIAEFMMLQLNPQSADQKAEQPVQTLPERSLAFASRLWGQANIADSTPLNEPRGLENRVHSEPDNWNSPQSFVSDLMPAARKAAAELGTSAEAVLAIAALETGWGKHVMPDNQGGSSHNLFGIKAFSSHQERVNLATLEYEDGVMRKVRQPFRVYDSAADSVEDFSRFLRENPRYSDALEHAGNANRFIHEIHKAGYATDPDYADKAMSVLKQIKNMHKDTVAFADHSPQGS